MLCIGFAVIGCAPNYNKVLTENMLEFEIKEQKFIALKVVIEKSNFRFNEKILINRFSKEFQEIAQGLGVESIEINNYQNCPENSIIFNVGKGWNIDVLNVVQFIYDSCDERTGKGEKSYDGNHIDIWGLGSDWIMLADTDLI